MSASLFLSSCLCLCVCLYLPATFCLSLPISFHFSSTLFLQGVIALILSLPPPSLYVFLRNFHKDLCVYESSFSCQQDREVRQQAHGWPLAVRQHAAEGPQADDQPAGGVRADSGGPPHDDQDHLHPHGGHRPGPQSGLPALLPAHLEQSLQVSVMSTACVDPNLPVPLLFLSLSLSLCPSFCQHLPLSLSLSFFLGGSVCLSLCLFHEIFPKVFKFSLSLILK